MVVKIVAVGDPHYGPGYDEACARRSEIADILLQKVVDRSNTIIRPDVVLILGDLLQGSDIPDARERLERLAEIIGQFNCPVITIPGNHDPGPDEFFRIIQRPPEWMDVRDVRFLPFIDPEMPECNARRTPEDIARVAKARHNHSGPIVSVQHVPLLPAGTSDCQFIYTNGEEIIGDFKKQRVALSIGAHHHRGVDLYCHEGINYVVAPGLCQSPFSFSEITIHGDSITARRHDLKLPEELGLIDSHVHTEFAYCSQDVEIAKVVPLAEELGLAGMIFAEHSGHLYASKEDCFSGLNYTRGISAAKDIDRRMEEYFRTAGAHCPPEMIGLEVSCDYEGKPMIDPEAMSRAGFLIGALHRMRELERPERTPEQIVDSFLSLLETFLASGIHALAHPFRIFHRSGLETPHRLFAPTVKMLRENNVAAELNFHGNDPPPEFFRMCLDAEVKLTFGSDAHCLWEVGELTRQIDFLEEIGFDGDLNDVLLDPFS